MKRILVLIAVVALLVAGTVSVLADPIVVGGSFTTSIIESTPSGNGHGHGRHSHHGHRHGKPVPVDEPSVMLSSPIVVGGS